MNQELHLSIGGDRIQYKQNGQVIYDLPVEDVATAIRIFKNIPYDDESNTLPVWFESHYDCLSQDTGQVDFCIEDELQMQIENAVRNADAYYQITGKTPNKGER